MVLKFFRSLFNMARDKWRAYRTRKAEEARANRVIIFPVSSEQKPSSPPVSKLNWSKDYSEALSAEIECEKKPSTTTLQIWKKCIDRLAMHVDSKAEEKAHEASEFALGTQAALLPRVSIGIPREEGDFDENIDSLDDILHDIDDSDSLIDAPEDIDSLKETSHTKEALSDYHFSEETHSEKHEAAKHYDFLKLQKRRYEIASKMIPPKIVEEKSSSCWAVFFACFRKKPERSESTVSYSRLSIH